MEQDNDIDSEIYEERAEYLVNTDEMIMDTLGNKAEMRSGKEVLYHDMVEDIEIVRNIKIVDALFTSKEFRTFIEITDPRQITKRKIQPLSPQGLKDNNTSLEPGVEEA